VNSEGNHHWKTLSEVCVLISPFFLRLSKMNTNGFGSNILVLDGKNWERWSALMRSLFGAQDMSDLVQNGYEDLVANATEVQKAAFKENKKKDCKALFYIQQNVDNQHF